jgi:hypothetical protein
MNFAYVGIVTYFQRKIADVKMIRLDSNNKYFVYIIICLGAVHKRRRPFRGGGVKIALKFANG